MTPDTGNGAVSNHLKYVEERHRELRTDYCGEFGNGGFKKDVQMALYQLQQKADEQDGYRRAIKEMTGWVKLLTALILAAIALLAFFPISPIV